MPPGSLSSPLFPYTTLFRSSVQDFCPCLGVVGSNNVGPLVHDAPSHAVKAIRRREKGIKENLLVPSIGRLEIFEHDLVSLENRSEEHTSELQSLRHLVCRLL